MRTQDPLCQLSECHFCTLTHLSVTFLRLVVKVMTTIKIPTSISFTEVESFCHLFERTIGMQPFIGIQNVTPNLCILSETNRVGGVNFNGTHWNELRTMVE